MGVWQEAFHAVIQGPKLFSPAIFNMWLAHFLKREKRAGRRHIPYFLNTLTHILGVMWLHLDARAPWIVVPGRTVAPGKLCTLRKGSMDPWWKGTQPSAPCHPHCPVMDSAAWRGVIIDGTGSFRQGPTTHLSALTYGDNCPNSEGELPASLIVLTGGPLLF